MRFSLQFSCIICFVLLGAEESLGTIQFEKADAKYMEIQAKENDAINTTLTILNATSTQPGAVITFSIKSKNDEADKYIRINPQTGRLSNIVILDSEDIISLPFAVEADDGTDRAIVHKILHVYGVNDNPPSFPNTTHINVNENATYGDNEVIGQVHAYDADLTDQVVYAIITNTTNMPFGINQYTGNIILKQPLDYEKINTHTLNVSASDGIYTSYGILIIKVNDMDEQGCKFTQNLYHASLNEGTYTNKKIEVAILAYDLDLGRNESSTYSLPQSKFGPLDFRINETTGELYVNGSIDYESGNRDFAILIEATSTIFPPTQAIVLLRIDDVNDNKPQFEQSSYHGNVAENSLVGTRILRVSAHDKDQGNNSVIRYLIDGNQTVPFLVTEDGEILVNGLLDREQKDSYVFRVIGEEALTKEHYSNSTNVTITIDDVNDNTPRFLMDTLHVKLQENMLPPVVVANLTSVDNDTGLNGEVRYSIQSNPSNTFYIDEITGVLKTNQTLDREKQDKYEFILVVHDLAPLPQRRQSSIKATIDILDKNDNTPAFREPRYEVDVSEAVPINTLVTTMKAVDEDIGNNSIVKYSIINGNNGTTFSIDNKSGEVRTNQILDRESIGKYELTILAEDGGNKNGTCVLSISILDVNDNQPSFQKNNYTFSVLENQNINTSVGIVKAEDGDFSRNGLVKYSIVPPSKSFTINSVTGEIKTLRSLDREKTDSYTFLVKASDSGTPSKLSSMVEVLVKVSDENDNDPVFVPEVSPTTLIYRNHAINGTTIYTFNAEDKDIGDNAVIHFSMNTSADFLEFDTSTGEVKINSTVPEHPVTISMSVRAFNPSSPSSYTMKMHTIQILTKGHYAYAPTLTGTVSENQTSGTRVNLNKPIETPEGVALGNLFCGVDCPFEIRLDKSIYTTKLLDRESMDEYSLLLPIPDQLLFIPINITVLDVDDNPPYCDKKFEYNVMENSNTSIDWSSHVNDADTSTIINKVEVLNNNDSRLIFSGTTLEVYRLDYERHHRIDLDVSIYGGGGSSICKLTLNVIDENDNPPVFDPVTQNTVALETASIGTVIDTIKAHDPDTNTTLSYEITEGNTNDIFVIDSSSGQIRTTMSLSTISAANDRMRLTIKASDGVHEAIGYLNITIVRQQDIVQMTSSAKSPNDVRRDSTQIEKSLSAQTNASVKIVQIAAISDGSGTIIDVYGISDGQKIDIQKAMGEWKVQVEKKESPKTDRQVGTEDDRDTLVAVIIVITCLLVIMIIGVAYVWYQRRQSFRLPVGKEHTQLPLSQVATISMVRANTAEKVHKI